MGVLPQALEIIFEVQRKKSNEKITRIKINFPTHKTHLKKKILPFGPLPTFKASNFLISCSF